VKILIDTNVLLSAALNPTGTPFLAYEKAVSYPNHGLICTQNIEELKRIFGKKFPKALFVV
jgi:predicted nucleic acid-binding protein